MPMSARENNLSEAGALLAGIARGTGHHKLPTASGEISQLLRLVKPFESLR
jgi:hypothetical protein